VQLRIDMAVHVLAGSDRPLPVRRGEAFTARVEPLASTERRRGPASRGDGRTPARSTALHPPASQRGMA
jgi:hypothetical protein